MLLSVASDSFTVTFSHHSRTISTPLVPFNLPLSTLPSKCPHPSARHSLQILTAIASDQLSLCAHGEQWFTVLGSSLSDSQATVTDFVCIHVCMPVYVLVHMCPGCMHMCVLKYMFISLPMGVCTFPMWKVCSFPHEGIICVNMNVHMYALQCVQVCVLCMRVNTWESMPCVRV